MDEDMSNRKDTKGDNFEATINGKKYDKRAEAGKALIEQVKSVKAGEHKDVGTLGGFKIEVDSGFLEPEITLSGKRDLVSFDVSDAGDITITTDTQTVELKVDGSAEVGQTDSKITISVPGSTVTVGVTIKIVLKKMISLGLTPVPFNFHSSGPKILNLYDYNK